MPGARQPGHGGDQLRQAAGLEKVVAEALIGQLKCEGRVVEVNERLAVAEHRASFRGEDARQLEAIEALFRRQAMSPPTAAELAAAMKLAQPAIDRLLKLLCEHGRLVRVADDLFFTARRSTRRGNCWWPTCGKRGNWRA